jgi:hypothetical protein
VANHKKLNLYWTERHETALQAAYEEMKARGIPCERNGEPNHALIILYALEQFTKKGKRS